MVSGEAVGAVIVTTCELPPHSAIDPRIARQASYAESYSVPLTHATSVVDVFFAVFGHHPAWLKGLLLVRHRIGSWFGLGAAATSDILNPTRRNAYRPGDTIGAWPIYFLSDDELVAGRDNRHLDFRVSVLKQSVDGVPSAVVSTVCRTHNRFGELYLKIVVPFHRWGLRRLLAEAHRAGRL
jgi:hypothetical protein